MLEFDARGTRNMGRKGRLVRLAQALKDHRQDFDDHYRELQTYFNPRRGTFNADAQASRRGKKINERIVNSRGTLALRTLQSGMQAGITSPARPWFRLIPADEALRDRYEVRAFTNTVERIMRQYFQSTGVYNALHVSYGDIGLYGTDCALLEEIVDRNLPGGLGIVLHQLPPGLFWLGANAMGDVDTLYMEDWLTVDQVVAKFVYRNDPRNKPDWDVVTQTVRNLWDAGNRQTKIHVGRLIMPRYERDPLRIAPDNAPWASIWWEIGATDDRILRESGYERNPIIASRWYRDAREVYGRSPAMDALPDVKMLQLMERDKREAVRRMILPPMNAPTAMRNTPMSLTPGAVNFTDIERGLIPAYEVNPPVDQLRQDIRDVEERINEALYANLFLMLANLDRRQITAREIDERHEEKLLGLGPVLELQHKEKLRPLILGTFDILVRQRKLPPPPPALEGEALMIDYISMLAQAQKAIATGGIERLFAFAGNLAAVMPEVLDNLDPDEAVNEYSDMLGVPTKVMRDEREIAAIREARAQQQQAAQQAEMLAQVAPAANQGAQAAKVLAEAASTDSPRDVLRRIGISM